MFSWSIGYWNGVVVVVVLWVPGCVFVGLIVFSLPRFGCIVCLVVGYGIGIGLCKWFEFICYVC